MTLADRIERVYMALEGKDTPRGARAWFARWARVRPRQVSAWLRAGEIPDNSTAASVLDLLEDRARMHREIRALRREAN